MKYYTDIRTTVTGDNVDLIMLTCCSLVYKIQISSIASIWTIVNRIEDTGKTTGLNYLLSL